MNKQTKESYLQTLIKLSASKSKDLDDLRAIFIAKYPNEKAAPALAVQYYNKFIKTSNPDLTLTENNLPQPLPSDFNELINLIRSTQVIKSKSKSEEFIETIKNKYPQINLTGLNEDYLSWLHSRYVENKIKSGEIVHPIEEALVTLGKFSRIQNKYKSSPEFRTKVNEAGYQDISSVENLTLDEMEKIITLDDSELTVQVENVQIKPEEFLGKFGEWNLWMPHTKETSVKIAGYDKNYNPNTDWCTARTKGSNLFYKHIGRKDIPKFLFYIIKDNPKKDKDWLSLGYVSRENQLAPDFTGKNGGLSVNRDNKGLKEDNYKFILKEQWGPIKARIETEIEKFKIKDENGEWYVSPGRLLVEKLAKNIVEFRKEFKSKSNIEKDDFNEVILDSNPSLDVAKEIANYYSKTNNGDGRAFLQYYINNDSEEMKGELRPIVKKVIIQMVEAAPRSFLDFEYFDHPIIPDNIREELIIKAATNMAEKDSKYFFEHHYDNTWIPNLIRRGLIIKAAINLAEKESYEFLRHHYQNPLIPDNIRQDLIIKAATNMAEIDPDNFLTYNSYNSLIPDNIRQDLIIKAATNRIEQAPHIFLKYHSQNPLIPDNIRQDLIIKAITNLAEKTPFDFLRDYSNDDRIPGHIREELIIKAATKIAKEDPYYYEDQYILSRVRELIKNVLSKQASHQIPMTKYSRLIHLSQILKSAGFHKEANQVKNLIK